MPKFVARSGPYVDGGRLRGPGVVAMPFAFIKCIVESVKNEADLNYFSWTTDAGNTIEAVAIPYSSDGQHGIRIEFKHKEVD